MFLKDSDGKRSFTVTMGIVAFGVVMFRVLLGGIALQIGGFSLSFGSIGAAEIGAILGPVLGTYSIRRYTDRKYGLEVAEEAGSKPGDGAE